MPNVKVTILDNNKNKYYLPGLTNPQTTLADGLFNFLVEPGVYYLSTSISSDYKFTANPNLHPNYVKIYHKMDGSNSIYKPDEPVVEIIDTPEEVLAGKPNMEHRDIPLDPGANKPYEANPSTIAYKVAREGIVTKIDGKVSHPFTDVTFSQSGNTIVKVKTDRFGYYEAEFYNNVLEQDKDISVLYTKADLKTINIIEVKSILKNFIATIFSPLVRKTFAESSIRISSSKEALKISPVFPYIEGYAYDQNNRIAPNAVIRLKLKMNKASIFETKSDNKGYFKILPKNIPIFPYDLEIDPTDSIPVSYTPSEFAKKNKEFLDNSKISLTAGTKDKKSLISGTPISISQRVSNDSKQKAEVSNNKSKVSSTLPILLIIFVFFILIALTVVFIIKNKNNSPISPSRF